MTVRRTNGTEKADTLTEYVVFSVSGILCGLKISEVREIKRVSEITSVHHAPSYVRGVINLRGRIVTVIDMCEKLNYKPNPNEKNMRIVIVKHEDEFVGLLVDTIEDAITAVATDLLPPPSNINRIEGRYFTSVYKMSNALVAILDKERILEKEPVDGHHDDHHIETSGRL